MTTTRIHRFLGALCAVLLAFPVAADFDDATQDDLAGLAAYRFGGNRAAISRLEARAAAATEAEARAALATAISGIITGEKTTLDGRREALRLFALVGASNALPPLLPLLSDPKVADTALWALEGIPGRGVDDALAGSLYELAEDRKVAVVQTLGRRKAASAVGAIQGYVTGEHAELAEAALIAMGMIGGEEAFGLLLTFRSAGLPPALRPALYDACLRAARSMERAEPGLAVGLYADLAGGGQPGHVRAGAVDGLVRLQPDRALTHIRNAFKSGDSDLRNLALSHVRTSEDAAITTTFTGLLPELPAPDKVLLIRALADRGDAAAGPAVLALAESEEDGVLLAVVSALGRIGGIDALDLLLEQATDGRRDLRGAARDSLATLPGAEVDETLAAAAKQGVSGRRVEAIRALGARRALGMAKEVRALVDDEDEDVRGAALTALRAIGGEAELKYLLEQVGKGTADADRFGQTIVAIAQRTGSPGNRAGEALRAYKAAKNPEIQAILLGILGRIGSADALDALRGAAAESNATLRMAAIQALAAWPDPEPLEDLLRLVNHPADDDARRAAFRGYARLLREAKDLAPADRVARYVEAMGLAQNADERRAVLAGLPTAPARATLALAAELGGDADLAAEALQAELQLCAALAGAYPDEISARIDAILAGTPSDAARAQADAIRNAIAAFDGYLTAWVFAGPYFEEAKTATSLFDETFPPEQDPASVVWNLFPMSGNPETPWALSLADALGGFERVAFLRTTVHAEAAQDAILELGTNDGCKVWLNGELIHAINVGRPLTPGEDQISLSLQEGANDLMIAVFQHGGDWSAAARLRSTGGGALSGVRATLPE